MKTQKTGLRGYPLKGNLIQANFQTFDYETEDFVDDNPHGLFSPNYPDSDLEKQISEARIDFEKHVIRAREEYKKYWSEVDPTFLEGN